MYTCPDCQRSYKTRSSLTRHAHNHSDDVASHRCSRCGVSFARRDILNRHLQFAHHDASRAARKRCHTACTPCRQARIRCDGEVPCHRCASATLECLYDGEGRRVSKIVRRHEVDPPSVSSTETQALLGARMSPSSTDGPSYNGLNALGNDTDTAGLPNNTSSEIFDETSLPNQSSLRHSSFSNALCDVPATDLDGMSWPWFHETLFLQDDPLFGRSYNTDWTQDLSSDSRASRLPFEAQVGSNSLAPNGAGNAASTPDLAATLNSEVDHLIQRAAELALDIEHQSDSVECWRSASSRLQPILEPPLDVEESPRPREQSHLLHRAILVYFLPKFDRLWPIYGGTIEDLGAVHPILYLVLVSIGFMYGTDAQKQFGTLLHKSLRRLLTASLFDLEAHESEMTWLAHARLLTQVQGLYFGQQQGFSYAQHLGAILVAQARRLSLFQHVAQPPSAWSHQDPPLEGVDYNEWKDSQMRKRLAFGILRADVFTSVLFNSRPLLSYEEIDLTLPCSNDLWCNTENFSPSEQLVAVRVEDRYYTPAIFSDLMRVFLDRLEARPRLGSLGHELCLFGLQAPIWKVSHDPDLFRRLIGGNYTRHPQPQPTRVTSPTSKSVSDDVLSITSLGITGASGESADPSGYSRSTIKSFHPANQPSEQTSDVLGEPIRRMLDMRSDRDRVESALERWYEGYQTVPRSSGLVRHRDTLMSSLLLLHMSYLRLYAPLHQLHNISYRTSEKRSVSESVTKQVKGWACTEDASTAAARAVAICDLVFQEMSRPPESRASFNFLAFGSLHHAAVVLWTVSQTSEDLSRVALRPSTESSPFRAKLASKDTKGLLNACARLLHSVNPLGGSSFGLAAQRLAEASFPST